MATRDLTESSKALSWLLRHGAPSEGIAMDSAGWVSVGDVLKKLRITREELEFVVLENNKSRLELVGARVRACQGHSRQGMPVTLDALEASWEAFEGEGPVFHGTQPSAVEGIAAEGILAQTRTHVHLAETKDSEVGKRSNVGVLIAVSPRALREAGIGTFKSGNGVVLVRHVPPSAIVGLECFTAKARKAEASMRAALRIG